MMNMFSKQQSLVHFLCWALLLFFMVSQQGVAAENGGFSGGVTPSRFEITASAGKVVKRTFSIYNVGDRPTKFSIETADWDFSPVGKLSFNAPLTENSCRPWVRLERHEINVLPSANKPHLFRFEVHVPENTPAQECRFALMVSSLGEPYTTTLSDGSISLPVTGRIAVIVYLAVGDVAPKVVLEQLKVVSYQGAMMPVVQVRNEGQAHGRLDGELAGKDANGNSFELFIATSPIMVGQTREMVLTPEESYMKQHPEIVYPITVTGKVYADKQTFNVNTVLDTPK